MTDDTGERKEPHVPYKIVPVTIWYDPRNAALSARGRELDFYVRTGPQTGVIPGLFRFLIPTAAADMRRDARTVTTALRELIDARLVEYDDKACVIWRPDALNEQPPANPNVILGWRTAWMSVPSCALKDKVCAHLAEHAASRGPNFSRALNAVLGTVHLTPVEPFGEPRTEATSNKQEQQATGGRGRAPVGGLLERVAGAIDASPFADDFESVKGFARKLVVEVRKVHSTVHDDDVLDAVETVLSELPARDIEKPSAMLIDLVLDELAEEAAHEPMVRTTATVEQTPEVVDLEERKRRAEFAARMRANVKGGRSS